jgi:S1-C subfamily serine protease
VPPDHPPPFPASASVKACFKRAAVARIAYIRAYGAASGGAPSSPSQGAASRDRIGPSFDCSKDASYPLSLLLCADADLSRLDLRFGQAYWALYQQLGPAGQPQLKAEDLAFFDQVQDQCDVPRSGSLTAEVWRSRDCVRNAYQKMREVLLGRLSGPAREEALRTPEKHLALQQALQDLGFLPPGPNDGVYGRVTRAGIVTWQSARGRQVTGVLGDLDALALEGEISTRAQTIAGGFGRSRTETPGEGSAPKASPSRVVLGEPSRPPTAEPKLAATGTAFAINKGGEFLTNYHVVKGCSSVRLRVAGAEQPGTIAYTDDRNDLALVRTRVNGIEPLRFREGGKGIRPADGVVALGFPYDGLLATSPQVTTGTVSALAGMNDDTRELQLTAPIQPGNSGGPLLDFSGNVVGIVSSRINALAVAEATGTLPQNINFAIKSAIIQEFLEAHRVDYATGQSLTKLDPADVGEMATKSTVLLECYK